MQALAIEAALSAGNFERASRLIDEPLVASMILSLQFATLIRWLECFPREQLLTHVFLCLTYAFSLFGSETPQAHEGPLAVAEHLFQAERNHKGLGQAYTLRAIAARTRGDGVQAIKYGSQAFQLLPEDALLARSTATSALAEGYLLNGEVGAARRLLAEARSLHEQANNLSSLLGAT
jgi:ATP/maltotriose-dependent transcriptional regulator MalT